MPTPRGTCPYGRKPLFPISGPMPEPLYTPPLGRGERQAEVPSPAPESIPVRVTELGAEMRICRYTNSIPAPPSPALAEALCLLRRQNDLLTEILAALAEK